MTEDARVASVVPQPVVETTMAGLARESVALQGTVAHAVQRQLDDLPIRFGTTAEVVSGIWSNALSAYQRLSEALVGQVGTSLDRFAETFEQRSAWLLDGVIECLDATVGGLSATQRDASGRQKHTYAELATQNRHVLEVAAATFERHATSLQGASRQSHTTLQAALEVRDARRLAAWTEALSAMDEKLSQAWKKTGVGTVNRQQDICDALAQIVRDIAAQQEASHQSQAVLQAAPEAKDAQRLAARTDAPGVMGAKLSEAWERAGVGTVNRQQQICDTLEQAVRDIPTQTQAHASDTIGRVSRLVRAVSEAPRAAAEVVAELYQRLTDSMVRGIAMLDEHARLLSMLGTLLGAINHVPIEQRAAADTLVAASADLLGRVGGRFADRVETETGKPGAVVAQMIGSAVEVASLGEAFDVAIQLFGESNNRLAAQLQCIEAASEKSLTHSDEQLAYYVAQAREMIDPGMLSQKQILEGLQRLGDQRVLAGTEAA